MGKVKSAATAIKAALADTGWDKWARVRLLGAQVEIEIAAGDAVRARAAVEELGSLVEAYPSPALEAGRRQALGRVLLAEGDPVNAAAELQAAIRGWREVGSPYEVGRSRAVLAAALRAIGDDDDADLELQAARDEFAGLGAEPDLAATEREMRAIADQRGRLVQVRMTFMFTDIVGSTTLAEALGDDAWERLLRWHDDTLRTLIGRHGGRIVHSTGDGFFVAFEAAARAVDCAIAIQRALAQHRAGSGFAPPVRIGLHTADATQRGEDFSGIGVHVAARVAASAGGDEILVTDDVLDGAAEVDASEPREVQVKGIATPLRVASLGWTG
jgi:class 3 adenylate cyclase